MDDEATPLEQALLELGLEDVIPMWEATSAVEVREALPGVSDRQGPIAAALSALATSGQVIFYLGDWDKEPDPIPRDQGLRLVADSRWFDPETEPNGQRLFYMNVDNLVDPLDP